MSYSRFTIACITCEQAALVRSPHDLTTIIQRYSRERTDELRPLVDIHGFRQCESDTILLTVCYGCEQRRAYWYQMALDFDAPGDIYHARLTNPYVSASLIRNWQIIQVLRHYNVNATLGPSTNPRPVLRCEFIGTVIQEDGAEVSKFVRFNESNVEPVVTQTMAGFFSNAISS